MTQRMQLPPVDPDFGLVERRAEQLHAYARGLLQHLRQIRAKKKGERLSDHHHRSGRGVADRSVYSSWHSAGAGNGSADQRNYSA